MEASGALRTGNVHSTLADLDAKILLEALTTRTMAARAYHRELVFVQCLAAHWTVEIVA